MPEADRRLGHPASPPRSITNQTCHSIDRVGCRMVRSRRLSVPFSVRDRRAPALHRPRPSHGQVLCTSAKHLSTIRTLTEAIAGVHNAPAHTLRIKNSPIGEFSRGFACGPRRTRTRNPVLKRHLYTVHKHLSVNHSFLYRCLVIRCTFLALITCYSIFERSARICCN